MKPVLFKTISFLLLFSLFFAPNLFSQDKESAQSVLNKASKACLGLKSIEYRVIQTPKDNYAFSQHVPSIVVNIIQQKESISDKAGFDKAFIKVEGKMNEKNVQFSYNGDELQFFSKKNNEKVILKDPTQMSSMETIGLDLLLIRIFPFTNGFNIEYDAIELIENNDIYDQELCYKLRFYRTDPRDGMQVTSDWWISKKDYLPRALETNLYNRVINIKTTNKEYSKSLFSINSSHHSDERITSSNEVEENYAKEGLFSPGTIAQNWTLQNSSGKKRSLSEFLGKVVVIDFWGTWCMPCIKLMPDIQKIHNEFKDKDVVVMGLAVNDKEGRPQKFFKEKKYDYMLFPKADEVSNLYKIQVFPTLYIIDKQGKIVYGHRGINKNLYDELKVELKKLLN